MNINNISNFHHYHENVNGLWFNSGYEISLNFNKFQAKYVKINLQEVFPERN